MKKLSFIILAITLSLCFAGNAWALTGYYVDPAGTDDVSHGTTTGAGAWQTIQYAINSVSSGATINVAAGTYDEIGQIVINKNLTITGADKATTIITPNANQANWFQVNTGVTFNISKVKLDGTGRFIENAINFVGNGLVNDCWLTEIKGATKYDKGTALQVENGAAVNITNCTFDNIGRNGVRHRGTGTVSGNTYTGKGTGDWLDYFILAEYGCNITIDGNTVTNNIGVATSDGSGSNAISVWDDPNTTATITNNILTNNSTGIALAAINSTTLPYNWPNVSIGSGNVITGGEEGIGFYAFSGYKFTPPVTFGATTIKGATAAYITLSENACIGINYDISSVIFKDVSDNIITDNFTKEDLVVHAIDAPNRGLLVWNTGNIYVTPTSFVAPETTTPLIQRAIDAATAGDVINVAAGTYNENITVNKSVTLNGAASNASIISPATNIAVNITADNVTIDGFAINHTTLDDAYDAGIYINLHHYATIKNNLFSNNSVAITLNDAGNNTIQGNTLSSNKLGIFIDGNTDGLGHTDGGSNGPFYSLSLNNTITGNTIQNCVKTTPNLTGDDGVAIYVDAACESNVITNNQILNNTTTGYYAWKASNNTITNNTISGNGTEGIQLMGSSGNTITGNTIDGTLTGGNSSYGLNIRCGALSSTTNTITNNTITGSVTGIRLQDDYSTNNYAGYVTGNTITENAIYGNTTWNIIIENAPPTHLFAATCNWWGTAVPSAVATKISGNVQFLPFSTSETTMNCDGVGPVAVSDPASTYMTIQSAIDAANSGATITVAAGTYKEEVSFVGKSNLLLNGAGEGLTIIAPYREYTASNYGIFINNASEIIIQNLTIDGFANTTLTSGIAHFNDGIHWDALGGNNCIITHVTVKNIDRRGISVWPENVTNNEVSYCTIDNVTGISNGYGHAVKFNGSGKVEHCTISNVTGALLGNCDVTGGTLSIQDNIITNLTGLTTTPFDIGINFWCKQSNVIIVKNNTITANVDDNTGIYIVRGGVGSEISYNTLNLTGNGGLGIETGWENTWGFPIHHNTITMGKGGAGIVITGAGSDADPMLVYDNILTNSGADDLFTNDYTGYSLREVGLLLSGHQYTSRTGDANYSFNGNVYNNSIDGFKDGIVLVTEVYNAGGYKDVEIKLSGENKITNYETAARFGSISYTEPYPFSEIASTDENYVLQDLSMNYWGSASPDFSTVIDGKINYCPYYTNDGLTALAGPVVNTNTSVAYCTIQSAIDAATAGDVITVAAGTYPEAVTVNKANLTIQGAGSTATFITTLGATPGITVTANGTTIKNMGITNATELKEGIRINATVTNGLIVDNVNFTNLGNGTLTWDVGPWAYGIHIYGSLTNLDIKNCTFDALSATHTANGVYSELNTTLTTFNLENCLFTNNWNGLFLQSNINGFHAIGNTFGPQEITDMGACVAGIYIGDGPAPFSIDGVIIENNLFTSYGRGIYFCDYGTGGVIGSVDIKDNTFTNSIYSSGIRLMAYDEGTGSAKLEGPLTINNNTFTQSSPIVNGNGVAMIDLRVGAESVANNIVEITNNDITFTGPFTLSTFGMVFRGPIKKMDISGNILNGNSAAGASSNMPATSGIVLQSDYSGFGAMSSTADINILNNDIQGFVNGVAVYNYVTNAYGGIPTGSSVDVNNNSLTSNDMAIYSGAGATIAATCNWWGTIIPSEIGAKISGPVVWAPFLLTDDLTTPDCGGVSPVMNVTQGLPYSTIQSAIDATTTVNGDMITVAAGTYTEQVAINKDITIQSVTQYEAIIQGNVTISGAGATIDGFQINPSTTSDVISVSGNGVTIINNDLINSLGIGLHILSGITASGITVTNNKFLAYSEFAVKNDGTGTLDATNNWWGDASGPYNATLNICGIGGEISTNITFSPWWVDVDMTNSWPGAQDNTITVKNLKATKADISWRRTVGDGSFVLVKQNAAIGSGDLPLDCTSYDHFHTNFTAAHVVNTGSTARIVQYGNSTVCYLTGLVKLTTYYVRVLNYLGNPADGSAKYNREDVSKKFATPRAKEAIEGTDALAGTFSMGLIAPNPVTDNLNFALEVTDEQAFTIEVYDAEGKTVNQYCANQIISSGTHNINMTLSNLSSGLYTLVVKTGMDMAITHFIIAK